MVETRGGRRFAVFFLLAAFMLLVLGRWLSPVNHAALMVAAPFQSAISAVSWGVGDTLNGIVEGPSYRAQNQDLEKKIGVLLRENALYQEQAHENQQLRAMLNFQDGHRNLGLVQGRVIGTCPNNGLDACIFINLGGRDHVVKGMTVLDQNGYFVGTVDDVTGNAARVLLMLSPSSSVGALDQQSRAPGLVEGQYAARPTLNYVVASDTLHVGDFVVTSGQMDLYPRDIVIGQVASIRHDNAAMFQTAVIQPAADFQHLEFVQVARNFQPAPPTRLLPTP